MLLYYITDRRQFAGDSRQQRAALLIKIEEAARGGVDFIQLRERDLAAGELEALAREAVGIVHRANWAREFQSPTRLLINSRLDVALASGADGVHLRGDDISAGDARAVWQAAKAHAPAANGWIAVSCHSAAEVRLAETQGADFAVFAPVFEKVAAPQRPGAGLAALRAACSRPAYPEKVEGGRRAMPVLALGGVNLENAGACLAAGAAGLAAIRLFQENEVEQIVLQLRELTP